MNIEVVSSEKNGVSFRIDNPTIAEIMRTYLNQCGAHFAAWRREHPSKPLLMHIEASGTVKKLISDATDAAQKDMDELTTLVKKK